MYYTCKYLVSSRKKILIIEAKGTFSILQSQLSILDGHKQYITINMGMLKSIFIKNLIHLL